MPLSYYGLDAYLGCLESFPTKRWVRCFPVGFNKPAATAIILGAAGWNWGTLTAFHQRFEGKPHATEFYISSGPSRRNSDLGPGCYGERMTVREFNDAWEKGKPAGLLTQLDRFLFRLRTFVEDANDPNWRIFICPELEDNLSDKAFRNFAAAVNERCAYTLVRNPCMGGRDCSRARLKEVHGLTVPEERQIGNMDGCSINFNDGEKDDLDRCSVAEAARYLKASRGRLTLLWSANQQGRGAGRPFPPLKQRVCIVTDQAIAGMQQLLESIP